MHERNRLPFDLWTLQVFLAVCEQQTMAAAAASLGLTQPAVSQLIQEMERELGVDLFDRAMRPIALTPAGAVLRRHANILLSNARTAAAQIRESRRGYLPSIRIGLIHSLQRLLSVPLVEAFSAVTNQVVVLSGITSVHAAALLTRQLDLCIGADDLPLEAGLDRWPIVTEPYVLLAPIAAATQSVEALAASYPFIRYSARSRDGPEIERYLRRIGLNVPNGTEFDTPFGLTESVAAELGWALSTPLCLIEAGVPLERIAVRPLPHEGLARTLTLLCRHKELGAAPAKAATASVRRVSERCRQLFSGPLAWIAEQMAFGAESRSRPRKSRV
jgi:DNA-binding transcriptional LysR family regulator